jgi:hypothetical protein
LTGPGARWVGPQCSVFGVLGFSFKAILIKLAYAWHPVDPVTLLALAGGTLVTLRPTRPLDSEIEAAAKTAGS